MLLAVVDTHFPWILSGFRYWENFEFYKIDKNILFFSVHKMNDDFPAQVHPLTLIREYSITDIYCVFLNHTLGLLDYPGKIPGKQNYGLSELIKERNISIHTTIYPGGGYENNSLDQALKALKFLKGHPSVKSVFTNLSEVQKIIPKAHWIAGIINTGFYKYRHRAKSNKLQLLFSAFHRKEKGFNYLAKALNLLDPSKYHLHIVGDWESELHLVKHHNYTYYGTLPPETLREVYYNCHVIIAPNYKGCGPINNRFIPIYRKYVTLDGFPTTTAVDAMSTGCCLISTNPRKDYSALKPEEDYWEIKEKSANHIQKAIEYCYDNQDEMLLMAERGHKKILEYYDAEKNVRFKYDVIKGMNL